MKDIIKVPDAFSTTTYTIPEGTENISDGAFTGTQNPTFVTLPKTLKTIGSNTDTKIRTVEGYDNTPAAEWADDVLNAKYISLGISNVVVIPDKTQYSYDVNQDGMVTVADIICLIKFLTAAI